MSAATTTRHDTPAYRTERWQIERFHASQLARILRQAGSEKVSGSVTIHLSQGTPVNLEVKTRINGD